VDIHIAPLFEAECDVYNKERRDLYSSPIIRIIK
jgi:hypothetical protein